MEQEPLFHEDINAALTHVISALGGNKAIGVELWPSLSPEQAGRKLASCVNPDRPEHLKPDELVWILREGRRKGVHSAMAYLANECGYDCPIPREPEDERARLQRQYIEATRAMSDIAKRMERLTDISTAIKMVR